MGNDESVTREVLGMLARGELGVTKRDIGGVIGSVLRGFVEMTLFQCTQGVVGWKKTSQD